MVGSQDKKKKEAEKIRRGSWIKEEERGGVKGC